MKTIFSVLILSSAFGATAASAAGVTYQGRLLKPDGTPVAANVHFRVQIRSPGPENCLLYEEMQTKDLSTSKGLFALTLNGGAPNTGPFSLERAMQNRGVFSGFTLGQCETGYNSYTPAAGDGRVLQVAFDDGTFGGAFESLAPLAIHHVPQAVESLTVGGFNADSLHRVVDGTGEPFAVPAFTEAQHNTLLDLVNGMSSQYLRPASTLDGARLSAGSVANGSIASLAWSKLTGVPSPLTQIGGLSCADGKILKVSSGAWICADEAGGGGGVPGAGGASGQYLKSDGTNWAGADVTFSDIKNSVGGSAFDLAGCAAHQTVSWSSLTDMFTCQDIGSLDASAITSGTIDPSLLPAGASMWQDGGSGAIFYDGGSVGIGTTAPARRLHVFAGSSGASSSGNTTVLVENSSTNYLSLLAPAAFEQGVRFGSASGGSIIYNNAGTLNGLQFRTGGLTQMAIGSTGNVGIGTAAPQSKLDVNGTLRVPTICDETGANCKAISSGWGSGGSVNSVATGTGLTGGPITTTGTISIAAGGVGATELAMDAVTSVKIADSNVTTSKIADGNVTGVKLETLAGLSTGTYGSATAIPALTIDTKGRITAITTNSITGLLPPATGASGKYLKSDGTNWAGSNVTFSDIKNSVGGSAFNLAGCAANQTVSWSSLTDMFTCQNIGSLDGAAITSGTIAAARLPAGASMWQDGGAGKIYYSGGNIGVGTTDPQRSLEIAGPMRLSPSALPVSPGTGDIALDSGDGNKLKYYDGAQWIVPSGGGGGAPAGLNTQLQYNDNGAMAGAPTVSYDKALRTLMVGDTRADTSGITFLNMVSAALTPPSASTAQHNVQYTTITTGNNQNLGHIRGDQVQFAHTGTGAVSSVRGMMSNVQNNGAGAITDAVGVYAQSANLGGGSITNATALDASASSTGTLGSVGTAIAVKAGVKATGPVATGYGVYIDQVGGTTNYGLYQSDASNKNYFAGNVGVGTSSPQSKLDVNGDIRIGSQATRASAADRGQLAQGSTYVQTVNTSTTVNWSNGNIQEINTFACNGSKTVTMSNLKDGAAYTLLFSGAAAHSGFCLFSAGGYTFKTSGGNAAPTASRDILFTFVVINNTVVYSMLDNLQ